MDSLEFGEVESLALMSVYSRRSALSVGERLDDRVRILLELIKDLRTRDQKALVMLFGLDGNGHRTLKEIGKHCGYKGPVTTERARQITLTAIRALKRSYGLKMSDERKISKERRTMRNCSRCKAMEPDIHPGSSHWERREDVSLIPAWSTLCYKCGIELYRDAYDECDGCFEEDYKLIKKKQKNSVDKLELSS